VDDWLVRKVLFIFYMKMLQIWKQDSILLNNMQFGIQRPYMLDKN
tara:strand:- start:257 stop:391 length:135 start_codon:yes stop_codon:yes gene_type:complete